MKMLQQMRKDLTVLANPQKALILQRFFKTGKGQYGEGDIFLGITVPQSRKVAIKYKDLSFGETNKLLRSSIHEERLIAILILVHNFNHGSDSEKKKIYDFYLSSTKHINNWDLVDLSADKIAGAYLYHVGNAHVRSLQLQYLAKSKNIWERRIAMISTYYFIKNNQFDEALKIATELLHDKHDLIQKAVGWMLREVGKRSLITEENFLEIHHKYMPRTMLRYAIEKFPETLRKKYLTSPSSISKKNTAQLS